MIKLQFLVAIFSIVFVNTSFSQCHRWQQRVKYKMEADFDTNKHQYTGHQLLRYDNNSPDTLRRVFYHLYFNAFQPNSMMDVRSRNIMDPDNRVGARIKDLSDDEIGFIKVNSLTCNGKSIKYEEVGTILEVELVEAILPGESVTFEMNYLAQVPKQIRRSGRDNKEGIDYSMTQWYPKMCEYDDQGWHSDPYVGREFYGVWGDYDVLITMPSKYIIGGSGVLVNAEEIGYGYSKHDVMHDSERLTWHFIADNVHDFAFAADPDYKHIKVTADKGTILHFIYQDDEKTKDWEKLPPVTMEALKYFNHNYGDYAYPCYTFIQGGDGGMEYPMTTLISGNRNLNSLIGIAMHEWLHSWYQMMLATNEGLYAWMDEGFTSFAEIEITEYLKSKGLKRGEVSEFPWENNYESYREFITSIYAEPASTHSDHFHTNYAYGINAYVTGNLFLKQLEYIIGDKTFRKGLMRYYKEWKFKHPKPFDFIRIMEKESGLELDWFLENFIYTTNTIDYAIDSLFDSKDKTIIRLKKIGQHPMPIDITVYYKNGNIEAFNIPLRIMRGNKPLLNGEKLLSDWPWTNPLYEFPIDAKLESIKYIAIDPTQRLADINLANNVWRVD